MVHKSVRTKFYKKHIKKVLRIQGFFKTTFLNLVGIKMYNKNTKESKQFRKTV